MIERGLPCDVPYVSVILPCYNDARGIRDTLASLARQEYPEDRMEVLVVDNNSSDETPQVINEFKDIITNFKSLLERDNQSSYAARNRGIANAKGSVVAFIDADMSVERGWLTQLSLKFEEPGVVYLACGVTIYQERASIFAAFNRMKGFPIDEYVHQSHFAPTCCLAVRKSVFDEVGVFDSRVISGGDYEFGNRVYWSGKPLHYAPEIQMKHPARSSLRRLVKKYFRVGRGLQQLAHYYPDRYEETFKNLLNPLHLLPPMPTRFLIAMKHNSIWHKASYRDKLLLYLIDWGLSVSKYAGHVYEKRRLQAHV